jgi:putative nucleotidyltransferase with HDIG domain
VGVTSNRKPVDGRVAGLIAAMAAIASASLAAEAGSVVRNVAAQPKTVGVVIALTVVLQLFSVRVYGRGSVSVSAIGILASSFLLDPGTAMAVAVLAAAAQWARSRGQLHKAIFDASNFAIAAGASAETFQSLQAQSSLLAATVAGCIYAALNNGLLCGAMALSEGTTLKSVWMERFHWARFHFVLFGPVALAATIAYEEVGLSGLAAFALPPALMMLSLRQYLERTAAAVKEIQDSHARLRRAHRDTIAALSRTIEAKDVYTGGHTERVAVIAVALAERLGFRDESLEAIEIGALLHDIGKVGISEKILGKPGPLTDEEWEVMRRHPVVSDHILSQLDLNPIVRQCARSSHEQIDGQGYPDALRGDEIPLPARIVFVADALDALTSDRPYRAGRPLLEALAEIEDNAGTQFCPKVVGALRDLRRTNPAVLEPRTPRQLYAA